MLRNFCHSQKAFSRRLQCILWAVLALVVLGLTDAARAQNTTPPAEPLIQEHMLKAGDDWPIKITYYRSTLGKETPVIILLHMRGSNRIVWDDFAQQLQKEGYAVVAVDFRKHGESKGTGGATAGGKGSGGDASDVRPDDYQKMGLQDLEAVKQFLYNEHQAEKLNMNKIGIVAPEMSAPIALNYTMLDWSKQPFNDAPNRETRTPRGRDIRAVVLLSPDDHLPKMTTQSAMQAIRDPVMNIKFLILNGKKDTLDRGQSKRIYNALSGSRDGASRVTMVEYDFNMRGTEAVMKIQHLQDTIIQFFEDNLKPVPSTWQDRRSRFERSKPNG